MLKKKNNLLNHERFVSLISWKALALLRMYTTRFDDIKPKKYSNHSVNAQKKVRKAIIRAREIGLLPYTK